MTESHDIKHALDVFDEAIAGLSAVRDRAGDELQRAISVIVESKGRVILSGVGKSGLIAQKIAGTFTSTGTPSFFIHPVDAQHGDLGLVDADDVVIIISKSGMSDELPMLVQSLKRIGVKIVGMTGEADSYLGRQSDITLDTHVDREPGNLGLAPMTSTTVALVMGDAMAAAVSARRGFTAEQFARNHPSGLLGKKLTLTVAEVMRTGDKLPLVNASTTLQNALFEIMDKSIGCTGVVDDDERLLGIITDGDLKRILAKDPDGLGRTCGEVMTRDPKTCDPNMLAVDALSQMELNDGGPLLMYFIVDPSGQPTGLLHLHDILRAGLRA